MTRNFIGLFATGLGLIVAAEVAFVIAHPRPAANPDVLSVKVTQAVVADYMQESYATEHDPICVEKVSDPDYPYWVHSC